jgi:WD40 repeat protein
MTGQHSPERMLDDADAAKKRKVARRVARACGFVLAAIAAGVLYGGMSRPPTSPPAHTAPSTGASKGVQDVSLRRLGSFSLAGTPSSVQFSPDGKILVALSTAAGQGSQIVSWSTATAQAVNDFPAVADGIPADGRSYSPFSPFSALAFSPDGRSLTAIDTAVDYTQEAVDIWDVSTGQGTFTQLGSSGYAVVPGLHGLLAGVNYDGTAAVANVGSGQYVGTLHTRPDTGSAHQGRRGSPLSLLTFSPDGQTIAAADGYGKVYLWSTADFRRLATLTTEKLYNNRWAPDDDAAFLDRGSLTFSPEGKTLASGTTSGIIHIWDVASRRTISEFSVNGNSPSVAPARPVITLLFSPGGHMLVTADNSDGVLSVWDVNSGRNLATLTVADGDVTSAAFTPAGTLLVATTSSNPADHSIELWATAKSLTALLTPPPRP